jgi:DNA ligase (NAD+)
MNIDGLGEKIVDQLVDCSLVETPADLYRLNLQDIIEVERMGELSANNLLSSIAASRKSTLSRFIYALGIPEVGEGTAKDLAILFGSLERLKKALPEVLEYIPNVGQEVAQAIYEFFSDEHNRTVVENLCMEIAWEPDRHVDIRVACVPTLANLIDRLKIVGLGKGGAEKLAERFGSLSKIMAAHEHELLLASTSPKAINGVLNYFADDERKEYALKIEGQLKEFGMHWEERSSIQEKSPRLPLEGKIFVLTGKMPNMEKDEAKQKIEAVGGRVSSSVSSKTSYVVVGNKPGEKLQEAIRLGIKLLDESELLSILSSSDQMSLDI